jgi:hypothetical protein
MKGFEHTEAAEPYLALAHDFSPEALYFSDDGLDLTVYLAAAARLRRDRYCFLNSYSEPLIEGWLARLDAALALPGAAIAGASGSWASTRSMKIHLLGLSSAYAGVLPEPRVAMEQFNALETDITGETPAPRSAIRARLERLHEIPERTLPYDRFPAYHVRTNAFMISHTTLAELDLHSVPRGARAQTARQRIRQKHDVHLLEHGRHSITRQLQRKGLRTLVVDRDGAAYDHEHWHRSRTFWQGDQEGLLVADNQTRRYAEGDAARRRLLSAFAWGPDADPAVPTIANHS